MDKVDMSDIRFVNIANRSLPSYVNFYHIQPSIQETSDNIHNQFMHYTEGLHYRKEQSIEHLVNFFQVLHILSEIFPYCMFNMLT